jgi:hypothetical protein
MLRSPPCGPAGWGSWNRDSSYLPVTLLLQYLDGYHRPARFEDDDIPALEPGHVTPLELFYSKVVAASYRSSISASFATVAMMKFVSSRDVHNDPARAVDWMEPFARTIDAATK